MPTAGRTHRSAASHPLVRQDIVFVPQQLSSPSLTPDRYADDWDESLRQVHSLQEYGQLGHGQARR